MRVTVNLYFFGIGLHRNNRKFWCFILLSHWSGKWSVSLVNSLPIKYSRRVLQDLTIAKHSFSIVLYRCSLGSNFLLMNIIGCFCLPFSYRSTAPSPLSQASVCKMKLHVKSGFCKMGYDTKACFRKSNASWCTLMKVHLTLFGIPFPVRSVKTADLFAKWGIHLR